MLLSFVIRYFSKNITSFKQHSTFFYILIMIIHSIQNISLFLYIYEYQEFNEKQKQNAIILLNFVLPKGLLRMFPSIFMFVILGIVLTVVIQIFINLTNKENWSTFFFQFIDLFIPVFLTLSYEKIKYSSKTPSYFCLAFFCSLWILRLLFVSEDLKNKRARISQNIQFTQMFIYCLINLLNILAYQSSSQIKMVLQILSCCILTIYVIYKNYFSFYCYEFYNEQLEYSKTVCNILQTLGVFSIITCIYTNISLNFIFIMLLITVLIQRSGIIKYLFQMKYNKLIAKHAHLTNEIDVAILITLMCKKQNNHEIIKVQFQFHKTLNNLKFKLSKVLLLNNKNNQSKISNIEIKKYLCRNLSRRKSNSFLRFLTYFSLEEENFLKALVFSAQIQKSGMESEIILMTIKQRLTQFSNAYLQSNIRLLTNGEQKLCRITSKAIRNIYIERIQQFEEYLSNFTTGILNLSEINTDLLQKLCSNQINEAEIHTLLYEQAKAKNYLQQCRSGNEDKLIFSDILVCTYIYLGYYSCRQSDANLLQPYFEKMKFTISNQISVSTKQNMVCFVSGKEDEAGRILIANSQMIVGLGLSRDRIKCKLEYIDTFIPHTIAVKHKWMIMQYIERGTSNFIGNSKKLYIVINGIAKQINIMVQLYHNIDVITFNCKIQIVQTNQIIILHDTTGLIVGYTQQASKLFNIRSFDTSGNIKQYLDATLFHSGRSFKDQNSQQIYYTRINSQLYRVLLSNIINKHFIMCVCKLVLVQQKTTDSYLKLSINSKIFTKSNSTPLIQTIKLTTIGVSSKAEQIMQNIYTLNFNHRKFNSFKILSWAFMMFLLTAKFVNDYSLFYIKTSSLAINSLMGTIHHQIQIKSPYIYFRNKDIQTLISKRSFDLLDQQKYSSIIKELLEIKTEINNNNLLSIYKSVIKKPKRYLSVLTEPIFSFSTPSSSLKMNLLNLCTYFEIFQNSTRPYDTSKFLLEWKQNEIYFLFKQTNKLSQLINNGNARYMATYFIYCVVGIFLIYFIVEVIMLCCLQSVFFMPIQLLGKIQNSLLSQRIQRNKYLSSILKKIVDSSMLKGDYKLPKSNQKLKMQNNYLQIFKQLITIKNKPLKSKYRKFKVFSQSNKRYLHLLVILFCFIPLFIQIILYHQVSNRTLEILNFGHEFDKSVLSIFVVSNRLLDSVNSYMINQTFPRYTLQSQMRDSIDRLQNAYRNIKVQQLFKKYDIKWEHQHMFLYKDLCQNNDTFCPSILSGALSLGFLASSNYLITKSFLILRMMLSQGVTSQLKRMGFQTFVFYSKYMKSVFLNTISNSQKFVYEQINLMYNQLINITFVYLLPIILLTILTIQWVFISQRKHIKQIFRQTFTILPLRNIRAIRQFEFQLMKIAD